MAEISRRSLFGGALAGGVVLGMGGAAPVAMAAAAAAPPPRQTGQTSMIDVPFAAHSVVRVGLIGLGNRGGGMSGEWARVPGCVVTAVCDIRRDRAQNVADQLVAAGRPRPAVHGGTDVSYQALLDQADIDLVYIATPWEFHYVQARDAMLAGKHVAVELPIATSLTELWSLVDTSERTRKHLMLAENCCYGADELAMLKMSRAGVFGEVTNGHGGYLHDLRALLFNDGYYTDDWRRLWHTRSKASFYHMHGLAPVSAAMNINRGDRYTTVSATSTAARGLADYRQRFVPQGHRSWNETYINGDLVTCHIGTANGHNIRTEHDVSTPRPYSRINSVAGTRGLFEGYSGSASGSRVYFEPAHTDHGWRDFGTYGEQYKHWLVAKLAGSGGGHGGMDFIMAWRTVQLMRSGLVPDIDVYDSAAWCAPIPLSVDSIALSGAAVEVPDFTRGDWGTARPGLDSAVSDMPTGGGTLTPLASLAAAFDNVGITSETNVKPGDFDGTGNSFSAEKLAAAGLTAGATFTALGASIKWPTGIGKINNVMGRGQVIKQTGKGSKLVVVGSGIGTAPSGAVVVKYTDGTTVSGTITFPNWTAPAAGGATVVAASVGRNRQNGYGDTGYSYKIFAHSVTLDPAKTVDTVTLPVNSNLHFFGMGVAP
ncbi:MAG TPA: Gfo/Idh/MocA family oxidoreductase [Actinokineospora sp.]|nr:Gfo/Idh/MocA family oxidoreductase [Actinokineospora sp.]